MVTSAPPIPETLAGRCSSRIEPAFRWMSRMSASPLRTSCKSHCARAVTGTREAGDTAAQRRKEQKGLSVRGAGQASQSTCMAADRSGSPYCTIGQSRRVSCRQRVRYGSPARSVYASGLVCSRKHNALWISPLDQRRGSAMSGKKIPDRRAEEHMAAGRNPLGGGEGGPVLRRTHLARLVA